MGWERGPIPRFKTAVVSSLDLGTFCRKLFGYLCASVVSCEGSICSLNALRGHDAHEAAAHTPGPQGTKGSQGPGARGGRTRTRYQYTGFTWALSAPKALTSTYKFDVCVKFYVGRALCRGFLLSF